jgi:fructokinase
MILGGIEAGGTKFVCAVGTPAGEILVEDRFPTTTPDETIGRAIDFFQAQTAVFGPLSALGVSAFGPLDPDTSSPTYGYITTTPKPGWGHTDFIGRLRNAFAIPLGFDTDVNGAALAERRWGAAQGLHTVIYLTIGTGIGGGIIAQGELLHGLVHPEVGHLRLDHDWQRDPFPGICPYHGDCLEGMACGPSIERRWGVSGKDLPADHPAWDLEAHYLAQALQTLVCVLSPQRIILGGGVMEQPQLFPLLREKLLAYLNGYVQHPAILEGMDSYVVPPGLGNQAGVLGAIALAEAALQANME